ncbi:MAG: YggU family protein [Candidatus Micrarchaeota archaeon]|nr:YggU family protein [Candidatus Micrarchaeota archaeon]
MKIKKTLSGIIIEVRIKTGCPSFSIKDGEDAFLVEVSSPPVEGKANREIIKELKKLLRADSVEIISGLKSKKKTILMRGNVDEIYEKIKSIK